MAASHEHGQTVDEGLLHYLSPLGLKHINLTGDYPVAHQREGRR